MACAMVLAQPALADTPSLAISDLGEAERQHLRCTMLAGIVVDEFERGAAIDSYGLDGPSVEQMGDALFAQLGVSQGADEETVRALLKADFEDFSYRAAQEGSAWGEAQIAACEVLWTVALDGFEATSPDRAPRYAGKPVDGPLCWALNMVFADATRSPAGEESEASRAFLAQANLIEMRLLEEQGLPRVLTDEIGVELDAARGAFDPEEWDALPESEAEEIMIWCQRFAGTYEVQR